MKSWNWRQSWNHQHMRNDEDNEDGKYEHDDMYKKWCKWSTMKTMNLQRHKMWESRIYNANNTDK